VAAARGGGRAKVGCIILARDEDANKGTRMAEDCGGVPGFIGFAVDRTDFWEPLVSWRAEKTTRDAAVAEIVHRFREFVDIFESARVEVSAV
jgi:myo-inositol catabolism protein IolC